MRQSTQLITTQHLLEFPAMQDCSPSKETITDYARGIPARKNHGDIEQLVGDIEQAIDPFRDPVPAEESSSNNSDRGQRVSDRGQRVRDALARLQVFTNQFDGEFQRLCVLAQSGQLSTEDHLRLEEIRRTTGLTIACGSWRDRSSDTGSASLGLSSSPTPPSYHSRSNQEINA
jgi:hypothetical protein